MTRTTLLLALCLAPACSWLAPAPVCTSADNTLAEGSPALTCAEAEVALEYTQHLAGRPVGMADRNLILMDLAAHYRKDPADVRDDLQTAAQLRDELRRKTGLEAAELRSTRAWEAVTGAGPLDPTTYPEAARSVRRRVAAWSQDDTEKLVLTEADIEAWIGFASLCREVQSGETLKLSINNREQLYRDLRVRFESEDRRGKLGMVALGGFWPNIEDRWMAATYEEQQAWIKAATLPPPMTSRSMGYAAFVFEGDLRTEADTMHRVLGPFTLR